MRRCLSCLICFCMLFLLTSCDFSLANGGNIFHKPPSDIPTVNDPTQKPDGSASEIPSESETPNESEQNTDTTPPKESETESNTETETETEAKPQLPQIGAGVTLCLDAGHGYTDSGAVAYYDGTQVLEKDLNLKFASLAKKELEAYGYTVLMIRESDTSLLWGKEGSQAEAIARRHFAVRNQVDLFLSIHCNAANTTGRAWGTRIFYNGACTVGRTTANELGFAVNSLFSSYIADGSMRSVEQNHLINNNGYIVLQQSSMPSLLFELGFMSDPGDLALLMCDEWSAVMAQAIRDGVNAMVTSGMIG